MTRAERIVGTPVKLIPREGTITRGKRKGEKTMRWFEGEACGVWEAIVCNYEKANLTEKDALVSARLAKILHAENYNMDTNEVILWVPDKED